MKKNLTELVFILDRSGSMAGLESDTIGGYNSFLEKQKEEDGSCLVSTVLFNQHSKVIHDRVDLVKRMYRQIRSLSSSPTGWRMRHINTAPMMSKRWWNSRKKKAGSSSSWVPTSMRWKPPELMALQKIGPAIICVMRPVFRRILRPYPNR